MRTYKRKVVVPPDSDLISIAEAARESGYSQASIRTMYNNGKIKGQRIKGRVFMYKSMLPIHPGNAPLVLNVDFSKFNWDEWDKECREIGCDDSNLGWMLFPEKYGWLKKCSRCLVCGEIISVNACRKKFCSIQCCGKYNIITKRTCVNCGKEFNISKHQQKVCNEDCGQQYIDSHAKDYAEQIKTCSHCEIPKSAQEFHIDKIMLKVGSWCRSCQAKVAREYRDSFGDKKREHAKNQNLRANFGIGIDEYKALLEKQGGVCAICKKPETASDGRGTIKDLAVDHDHKTGRIRGLLCSKHNLALGLLKENKTTLRSAIEYIKKDKAHNHVSTSN